MARPTKDLPLSSTGLAASSEKTFLQKLRNQKALLVMSLPFLVWLFIFKYMPLWGWTMAFQDYKIARSFAEQQWIGLATFRKMLTDDYFWLVLRNTIVMSFIQIVLGFVTAITLAILLNELRNLVFKRVVQTISYLPHFISWVVAANIVTTVLAAEGIVNEVLLRLGLLDSPILWLLKGEYFWGIFGAAITWKELGWNTIIYLAAITMIDPSLYEAAEMDGASRWRKIWHITLPGMRSVIVILLIMNLGYIIESGFEPQYLLRNGTNKDFSENLDIYVLDYGMKMADYSLSTAASMFKTIVSFIFLFSANAIAKRLGESRLF
ncbi:ABC transporter permease [Paenibacillus ginsengihumi]|jgi:putative aldouronate transport system permease protein|uniref:ABC transporter permease n=1 Tax=Paenibacillus ginsengihumi TaxID=431596 RepID=UPI000366D981|nr:ABC transporter permease subunit [Paenibacillus ginsengihumi]